MGSLNGWCTSLAWALTVFSPYHHEALQQGLFTLQEISPDWTGLDEALQQGFFTLQEISRDWTELGFFGGGPREWGITRFSALEYQRNCFA
jgi:hypothetical protein